MQRRLKRKAKQLGTHLRVKPIILAIADRIQNEEYGFCKKKSHTNIEYHFGYTEVRNMKRF
jgi:hypothetical protein